MKPASPDIIKKLNEVLTLELTAINQYFLHAEMCGDWGFAKLYKVIRAESIDEMKHAEKLIERIQTLGGWVEQHWGDGAVNLTLEMATGGFMRLGSGLSNVTGPNQSNAVIAPVSEQAMDLGGTRRETIAYDKYLDMLALFHHNGSIYDSRGAIAMQGMIKITFDGMSWFGWFNSFSVQEEADKPYQFSLSAAFTVQREVFELRTFPALGDNWADGFKPSGGV